MIFPTKNSIYYPGNCFLVEKYKNEACDVIIQLMSNI